MLSLALIVVVYAQNATDDLTPYCGPTLVTVLTGRSVTTDVQSPKSNIQLTCFSYNFTSLDTSPSCGASSLVDAQVLLISINGNMSYKHPLDDLIGGSVESVSYYYEAFYNHYFLFLFPNNLNGCPIQIRYSSFANWYLYLPSQFVTPFAANTSHHVIFINEDVQFTLQYGRIPQDHPSGAPGGINATWSKGYNCRYSQPYPVQLEYSTTVQEIYLPAKFPSSGVFSLCVKPTNNLIFLPIMSLIVFATTPAYFTISGIQPGGYVKIRDLITVTFVGENLDTRRGQDRAKLVSITQPCAAGPPAGGVPEAMNLLPGDISQSKFSYWPIMLTIEGSYHVCYRPAVTGVWVEVPLYDDLPSASQDALDNFTLPPFVFSTTLVGPTRGTGSSMMPTNDPGRTTPTRTRPSSSRPGTLPQPSGTTSLPTTVPPQPTCPSPPAECPFIMERNPILIVSVSSPNLPHYFVQNIAALMCTSLSLVRVYEMRPNGTGADVVVGVYCDPTSTAQCQNYALLTQLNCFIVKTPSMRLVQSALITSARVANGDGINTRGNDNPIHAASSDNLTNEQRAAVISVSAVVGISIAVAAVVVFCLILRWRQKKQQLRFHRVFATTTEGYPNNAMPTPTRLNIEGYPTEMVREADNLDAIHQDGQEEEGDVVVAQVLEVGPGPLGYPAEGTVSKESDFNPMGSVQHEY